MPKPLSLDIPAHAAAQLDARDSGRGGYGAARCAVERGNLMTRAPCLIQAQLDTGTT